VRIAATLLLATAVVHTLPAALRKQDGVQN
jgi:hypothetical protein